MTATTLMLVLAGVTTTIIAFFLGEGHGYERGRHDEIKRRQEGES